MTDIILILWTIFLGIVIGSVSWFFDERERGKLEGRVRRLEQIAESHGHYL